MKSIIFDFDGTLIDSAEHIYNCYYLVTKKIAPHLLFKAKELIVGPTLKETIELILGKDNKDLFDIFFREFIKIHDNNLSNTKIFNGVQNLLDDLYEKNIQMAIATNKRLKPTRLIIKHLKLEKYFSKIICTDSFESKLNKKQMLKVILEDKKFKNAIMIGDTINDFDAAISNGIEFIKVSWGYGNKENWEQKTYNEINKPSEITRFVTMAN